LLPRFGFVSIPGEHFYVLNVQTARIPECRFLQQATRELTTAACQVPERPAAQQISMLRG
jgi:hypothetical protein